MIDIVLCASGRDEVRIVHDIAQAGGGARVVRRCADLTETLAASSAGVGDAVVIDLTVRGLTREHLETLAGGGVVVGLVPSTHADADLPNLAHRIPAEADVGTLLETIVVALEGGEEGPWEETGASDPEPAAPQGRMIAFWGPGGSTGRSTVAMNLAAENALDGVDTVLVDADTHGPALNQMLGLLEEGPGLIAACRAIERQGSDGAEIAGCLDLISENLRLLGGIGVARRWPEVGAKTLDVLWTQLRTQAETVLVDLGPSLERSDGAGAEHSTRQRNAAALSALAAADEVIAVVSADPVSITRLLRERESLHEATTGRVHVIVNRMGAPVPEERIRDLIAQRMDLASLHVLPDDPAACRRAAWDGSVLAESAPRSALRRGLRSIAHEAVVRG